tara:strand:+ start:111 stop:1529 length:1419 start_codon:yes stop_codon:yes gene_type:complete
MKWLIITLFLININNSFSEFDDDFSWGDDEDFFEEETKSKFKTMATVVSKLISLNGCKREKCKERVYLGKIDKISKKEKIKIEDIHELSIELLPKIESEFLYGLNKSPINIPRSPEILSCKNKTFSNFIALLDKYNFLIDQFVNRSGPEDRDEFSKYREVIDVRVFLMEIISLNFTKYYDKRVLNCFPPNHPLTSLAFARATGTSSKKSLFWKKEINHKNFDSFVKTFIKNTGIDLETKNLLKSTKNLWKYRAKVYLESLYKVEALRYYITNTNKVTEKDLFKGKENSFYDNLLKGVIAYRYESFPINSFVKDFKNYRNNKQYYSAPRGSLKRKEVAIVKHNNFSFMPGIMELEKDSHGLINIDCESIYFHPLSIIKSKIPYQLKVKKTRNLSFIFDENGHYTKEADHLSLWKNEEKLHSSNPGTEINQILIDKIIEKTDKLSGSTIMFIKGENKKVTVCNKYENPCITSWK